MTGDGGGVAAHQHDHDHHHGHGPGHGHDHRHGHVHRGIDAARRSRRRLALSLGCTTGIMVAEAVGGLVSGSLALVSDAGHMLTDSGALALAFVAALLAERPADDRRTYGYRRAEVLGAQLNVAILVALSGWIGWEAIGRLRAPAVEIDLPIMAVVGFIGLVANLAILRLLHDETGVNARSAFLHVLSDAVSSVAVLAAAGVMALWPGATWVDAALSLLIVVLILAGAFKLIQEITHILMEAVPAHLDVAAVARALADSPGVAVVHDLHIWTIASGMYALSVHVGVEEQDLRRNDEILDRVKQLLRERFAIDHTTVQIETTGYDHANDPHAH